MASEFAREKFSFRLNPIEILAIISFLFMLISLILSVTTEDPKEFVANSVRTALNNEPKNEADETPKFSFSDGGGAGASTPKVIFANEGSIDYKRGMQELVDQKLLPSIPESGDDSYFYFEDLIRDQKVFIARLELKDEEENCITSNTEYSCIFYTKEELTIFFTKEGTDETEIVFDNRK